MSRPLPKAELIKALRMISERAHAAKSVDVWEKIGGIQYLADNALGIYKPTPPIDPPVRA
jgi:hypothetical protein